MDTSMHENRGAFPVDQPTEALKRDHNTVRKLIESYQKGHSEEVKMQAAREILTLLDIHSQLEEGVFYPAVRTVDQAMIAHFEEDHQKADDLVHALKGMQLDQPQAEQMMRQLIDMTLEHIDEEENKFFPKLDNAGLDMAAIGLQMQSFEANLVHMQAQASEKPGARR